MDRSNWILLGHKFFILGTFSSFQVVAGDVEDVAKAVLGGVEDALADKRKELMSLREKDSKMVVVDFQQFTREVNVVIR